LDQLGEMQRREQQMVRELADPVINEAQRGYNQVVNGLWLANGAAALATLAFIGSRESADNTLLMPLTFFCLGLIARGIGAVFTLMAANKVVEESERVTTPLALTWDQMNNLLGGYRWWLSKMAAVAGVFFVVGVTTGLAALWAAMPTY
jgi:hypothetical protein